MPYKYNYNEKYNNSSWKNRENRGPCAIKNADKITMTEIIKVSSIINLVNRYN